MSDSENTELVTESEVDSSIYSTEQINQVKEQSQLKPKTKIESNILYLRTMINFPDWTQIRQLLSRMAQLHFDSDQIFKILAKFKHYSSRHRAGDKEPSKKAGSVSFQALQQLYESNLPEIFGKVAAFVLKRNDYQFHLFLKGKPQSHTYSKQSIIFLICSMTLFLIPRQEYHNPENKNRFAYQCDFSFIFQFSKYKTRTIIEYLRQQLTRNEHKQQLTICRQVAQAKETVQKLIEQLSSRTMCTFRLVGDNESIQDYFGSLKVDFANRFIGGGALSNGCVQEEIMFANHPELYMTPLICEVMEDNEAIILTGFKKYACNTGYSYSTTYRGPEIHPYQFDQEGRAKEYIIAIDAISFPKNAKEQFLRKNVQREILKAYVGFRGGGDVKQIVTGNWGCGAFGGELRIKLLIQWIACTLAGKQMIYCPFGQRSKLNDKNLFEKMGLQTVGECYKSLIDACRRCLIQCKYKGIADINIYQKLQFVPSSFFQQHNEKKIILNSERNMKQPRQQVQTKQPFQIGQLKNSLPRFQTNNLYPSSIDIISIDSSESQNQQKSNHVKDSKSKQERKNLG